MAATRKTTAPEPFVDAEKAARVSVFSLSPSGSLPARAKSRRILWARDNTGYGGFGFLSLRLRWLPTRKINSAEPCRTVQHPCRICAARPVLDFFPPAHGKLRAGSAGRWGTSAIHVMCIWRTQRSLRSGRWNRLFQAACFL